jgi:hypothetical protein
LHKNPYKYIGPLDPVEDDVVCIPRAKGIKRLINGINRGDYWAILGPRQIGKTTLLHLLKQQFPKSRYLYFNFAIPPVNEENLYQLLMDRLQEEFPSVAIFNIRTNEKPDFRFFEFLKKFNHKETTQKIVFLFDRIDQLPSLGYFLHVWRNLYHERYHQKKLHRYAVIIIGSVNLIEKTGGPNSPFNIAKIFEMKDLSNEESAKLIEGPMKQLNIKIETGAKEYLLHQVSGHPQLLQHLCHLLVETAIKNHNDVNIEEVDKAITGLFKTNSTLDILGRHFKENKELARLVKKILKGESKVYYPYKEFSFSGVGAIVDNQGFCSIRNNIFARFLEHIPGEEKSYD